MIYRLHDSDEELKKLGCVAINPDDAKTWNEKGYGIFETVNLFRGARRIENLTAIRAWALDLDDGTKEEQFDKIKRGLPPSFVIESKRGYQVYFLASNAKKENWNHIMLDRLIPFYGADKRARDLARVLRVPGFFHKKDPSDPFLVKEVFRTGIVYSESEIAFFFKSNKKIDEQKKIFNKSKPKSVTSGDLWERIWEIDCEYALTVLSGNDLVSGEVFTFKTNRSGTRNILVNGKSTSTWIDASGRIGSLDDGGPTIYNWLVWYGNKPSVCVEYIKQNLLSGITT